MIIEIMNSATPISRYNVLFSYNSKKRSGDFLSFLMKSCNQIYNYIIISKLQRFFGYNFGHNCFLKLCPNRKLVKSCNQNPEKRSLVTTF